MTDVKNLKNGFTVISITLRQLDLKVRGFARDPKEFLEEMKIEKIMEEQMNIYKGMRINKRKKRSFDLDYC